MKMNVRRNTGVDYILLIPFFLLVFVAIFPLFWMLVTSFKTPEEFSAIPLTVFPVNWFKGNYIKIFTDRYFPRYFLNSVVMASVVTVVAVASSTFVGYIFAKFKFPGKNIFFYAILITIMVPFESFIVPLFGFVRNMNAMNSYWGLIFPSVISSFGIFFIRQNMEQIPDALLEAAKIDGAGNYYTFFKIVIPLSISAISVLSILLFLIEWSSYLWPLLIATKREWFVLEIGLTLLQDEYFIDYGVMMAGCAVAMIPVFILFLFFRRHIMDGIAMTGIKG